MNATVVAVPSADALTGLDRVAHHVVHDLYTARPVVFWVDLGASVSLGWGAMAVALRAVPWSVAMWIAVIVSALGLYRALCFVHEIVHLRRQAVPGFETAWNLFVGLPLLLPTFAYSGVHQSHHSLSTYGTKDDPEYLPFARSRKLLIGFAVQSSLVLPILLALRFLVLAPVGLLVPPFHRWLETYASSFSMNPAYRRVVPAAMASMMRRWEVAILIAWSGLFVALSYRLIPVRVLALWLGVFVIVNFLNTVRVLGAHEYESDGTPRDRQGQLIDSIDTPGGPWNELLAPVGLRYHALHHYFPGIPYHNLGTAYRRIVAASGGAVYQDFSSPSIRHSLAVLYRKAAAASRQTRDALFKAPASGR